eukprot:s1194_g18.t1
MHRLSFLTDGFFARFVRLSLTARNDPEDGPKPVNGLEAPRSGRAKDVVRYLWEEAQWDPEYQGYCRQLHG